MGSLANLGASIALPNRWRSCSVTRVIALLVQLHVAVLSALALALFSSPPPAD
ncbi:MAG: hypothetical protein ACK46L_02845 [Synechococcaceae cyanobacterium]